TGCWGSSDLFGSSLNSLTLLSRFFRRSRDSLEFGRSRLLKLPCLLRKNFPSSIVKASGSSKGADLESEVPDEHADKNNDTSKGTVIPNGMINDEIMLSKAYKTYLDYATRKVLSKKARKFKKPASPKLKTIHTSPKEPTKKGKRVKRAAKKVTTSPTTGVVITDTPDKSISKNIAPAKRNSEEKHGDSENKSDDVNDDNDDDGGNDGGGNDDSGNEDDYEENPSFTLEDYEEEEQDEEYVYTQEKDKSDDEEKMFEEEDDDVAKELYGDLNIT
nr:hypothetical protein [Tanacetum cinerariifolium]